MNGRLDAAGDGAPRVVVTGGAGFIGSHLCDRLVARGARVVCIDNLETGRMANISHLLDGPRFSFLQHDVGDPLPVTGPVDQIYNLACPASPPKYQRDPIHTFRTSVLGAINALDLAERTGAAVLQASTSEVYGDPDVSPQDEEYRGLVNTFGPRACYDEGKRAAETLCHDYAATRGVRVRVVRIFNTYGPRLAADDGRVVTNFINQALSGKNLTVYGTGQQTRSFCFIDDLVRALPMVMELPDQVVAPVNLGNPREFTVLDLAEKVLAKIPGRSRIVYHELPADDPRQRRPDIARIGRLTGWRPEVQLDEGLDRTIAYFRQEPQPKVAERVSAT
ncbi:MAG: UDP-glucuronic acid decarboxylase family protein [Paracoccaceae bacterium]|jgi:UDP-glucuronate decarboxylase|nr:UDP-glucuronic acid decarboxylase family protein [Paracoccaceae bacterium]